MECGFIAGGTTANKKYLVTGAAGFIGFHTTKRLLARGDTVVGYDNLVPYYPVEYKHARLKQLVGPPGFTFQRADLNESHFVGCNRE